MLFLALVFLIAAGGAAFWRKSEPVVMRGTKTTSFKPVVIIGLLVLAFLCFVAGGESSSEKPAAKPGILNDKK